MRPIDRSVPTQGTNDTGEAIREAALRLFYAQGYHATSVREIAKASGIGVASLFHHFPTKLGLLRSIIDQAMDGLLAATDQAYLAAGPDPVSKLRAIVEAHVMFAIRRGPEGTVGNSELRSLDDRSRAEIVAKRDRQQRTFDEAVGDGVRRGLFHVAHPREASRAILTMCTAVTSWYRESGPLSPEDIAKIYADLALSMVGYSPE
jgi:AcrR family transcriptional regulator